MYTISRRISNLEDIKALTKEEIEEAVRVERVNWSLGKGPFIVEYKPIDIEDRHHSSLQEVGE